MKFDNFYIFIFNGKLDLKETHYIVKVYQKSRRLEKSNELRLKLAMEYYSS